MRLTVLFKLNETALKPVFAHIGVLIRISGTEVASTVARKLETTRMYICFHTLVVTARYHAHSVDYKIMQGHGL